MIKAYRILELFSEQARRQNAYEDKLTDVREEWLEHLIKIFMWRDAQECDQWMTEVRILIHRSVKLKSNGKLPKKEFFIKVLWDEAENFGDRSEIDSILDELTENAVRNIKYGEQSKKFMTGKEREKLKKFIRDYVEWLADNLSVSPIINTLSVLNELKELLKKYPTEG